jgi:PRTRC genetic system ThiF family protein
MHYLEPELLRRTVRVLVVGCGGNGSAVAAGLPYLHQAMLVGGHPGGLQVTVMDGDAISPSNCVRQPFCQSEIGLFKAVVMVNRLNLFWGLRWDAVPEHLTEQSKVGEFDIVIGCVDTRAARRTIRTCIEGQRSRVAYWLDLGNLSDRGQFILGQPLNARNRRRKSRLRTVAELFPEILGDDGPDDGPSCSAAEAIERQEPFTNPLIAQHALALLAGLFRRGSLAHRGAFVDVGANCSQPVYIRRCVASSSRRASRPAGQTDVALDGSRKRPA